MSLLAVKLNRDLLKCTLCVSMCVDGSNQKESPPDNSGTLCDNSVKNTKYTDTVILYSSKWGFITFN